MLMTTILLRVDLSGRRVDGAFHIINHKNKTRFTVYSKNQEKLQLGQNAKTFRDEYLQLLKRIQCRYDEKVPFLKFFFLL